MLMGHPVYFCKLIKLNQAIFKEVLMIFRVFLCMYMLFDVRRKLNRLIVYVFIIFTFNILHKYL